jgi:hypothetical protein
VKRFSFLYPKDMEVKLTPDEQAQVRDMLDSRYDDLKSGRTKPIDGEEAFSLLKTKTEAQRNRTEQGATTHACHQQGFPVL